MSLLGTFLVRSGVLTSVHVFATDPTRGVFILTILAFFIGGSLALFAWRAPELKPGGIFAPVSREGALVVNNLLLTAAAATVLVGTLYPLALETLTGDKISVGPPFFNRTVGPLFLLLMIAMPAGPLLAWKRGDAFAVAQRLTVAAGVAFLCAASVLIVAGGGSALAAAGLFVGVLAVAGAAVEIADRLALFREPIAHSLARARGTPRAAFGSALAHAGIGLALLGVVAESGWSEERIVALKPGERVSIARFDLAFTGLSEQGGTNWRETVGRFEIRSGGTVVATSMPTKRVYVATGQTTTEAGISTFGLGQLYISLGDPVAGGAISARIYWKPFVLLIWLGPVLMALGGLLSLSDRRLRIGAPRRARRAAAVPAE
jgi:cytochrome c-type biogenesis protein CcmF